MIDWCHVWFRIRRAAAEVWDFVNTFGILFVIAAVFALGLGMLFAVAEIGYTFIWRLWN